jgi:hypothetical protein
LDQLVEPADKNRHQRAERRTQNRVRSHCRFSKRGAESRSESGMKWMNSSAKRQCDRDLTQNTGTTRVEKRAARLPPPADGRGDAEDSEAEEDRGPVRLQRLVQPLEQPPRRLAANLVELRRVLMKRRHNHKHAGRQAGPSISVRTSTAQHMHTDTNAKAKMPMRMNVAAPSALAPSSSSWQTRRSRRARRRRRRPAGSSPRGPRPRGRT